MCGIEPPDIQCERCLEVWPDGFETINGECVCWTCQQELKVGEGSSDQHSNQIQSEEGDQSLDGPLGYDILEPEPPVPCDKCKEWSHLLVKVDDGRLICPACRRTEARMRRVQKRRSETT